MLHRSQHSVHDDHRKDDHRTLGVAGKHGNHGCHDQDHHQQITKLLRKNAQGGFLLRFLQHIFPRFFQPLRCLCAGQSLRPGLQLFQYLLFRHLIPFFHPGSSFCFVNHIKKETLHVIICILPVK